MASKKQKTDVDALASLRLDEERYIALLEKLIGQVESLQNNPAQGLHPREDNASDIVLAALAPYSGPDGPLVVERISFVEGRGNVVITYWGQTEGSSIAFVGAHLDVVPANPEVWDRDPFKLTVEGDELHGRGVTDCLGHVALLTELMTQLATERPALSSTVTVVLIANEEHSSSLGIGVDKLVATAKLERLKSGPVFWVDCADSQPCFGTCGVATWKLKAIGKLFHSGIPQHGINAIELGNAALARIQERFYEEFPALPQEKAQKFVTPSTMKPTQIKCAPGGLNQLPPWVEIQGDVRFTPFYAGSDLVTKMKLIVDEINAEINSLPKPGPVSKFEIEGARGKIEFAFSENMNEGCACRLDSEGNAALCDAVREVRGEEVYKPYSIGGSLPLVRDMQNAGFDIQMIGFGLLATYHADNEYCKLSDMAAGFRILALCIVKLER